MYLTKQEIYMYKMLSKNVSIKDLFPWNSQSGAYVE